MLRGVKKELPPYMSETLQILHRDAERTGTEAGAYRVITKALSQLSRREHLLIGTINDACALGALRAVHEASRERFTAIVSQNFSPDPRISAELQENASPLVGSVAFFPEKYGARIIAVVVRWLNKEQVPPSIYTDHLLVTKNNIGEFLPMTDASVIGKSTQDSLEHGNP
jgi:ribose transport system substrate-binding protein